MQLVYKTVDGSIGEKLDRMFGVKSSFLRVEPSNCLLPPEFVLLGTKIRDMKIYDDDVWMVSYPRTGMYYYLLFLLFLFVYYTDDELFSFFFDE